LLGLLLQKKLLGLLPILLLLLLLQQQLLLGLLLLLELMMWQLQLLLMMLITQLRQMMPLLKLLSPSEPLSPLDEAMMLAIKHAASFYGKRPPKKRPEWLAWLEGCIRVTTGKLFHFHLCADPHTYCECTLAPDFRHQQLGDRSDSSCTPLVNRWEAAVIRHQRHVLCALYPGSPLST
jgi:hypothetical protein